MSFPQVSHSKMTQPHGAGVLYFSRDAETTISPSQLPGLSLFHHNDRKIVLGAEAYPSCSVTCMSLNLATLACGS